MSKVYLYSRVSTSDQSLAQQERTAYEWLRHHNMEVSDIVSDEGVSGGVSYKDRNLGKMLLPRMVAGDMLIVSEISRLGRSMFDLSKLIHEELKPRKIRLVVVGMGLDLRCDNLTAMDELILNNFSFAAQLEKQLISERTLSALQVKRKQGVLFGAANPTYKRNRQLKDKQKLREEGMKKGITRNERYLQSRDVQALLKIIRRVFPDDCTSDNPAEWAWCNVSTRKGCREQIFHLMRDFKDMDSEGKLFLKWDMSAEDTALQLKLASTIYNVRRSLLTKSMRDNNNC